MSSRLIMPDAIPAFLKYDEIGNMMNATQTMNNTQTTSVVLVGVGGQGILLASTIVARAAMLAGFDVKTNEVHGMAQRGGSVIAQIRYGKEVNSPLVTLGQARVLGSLERIEALRCAHYLAPDGLAVVSDQAIVPVTVSSGQAAYPADAEDRLRAVFPRLCYLDALGVATELGDVRAANVVLLGALSNGLDLAPELWTQAIEKSVAPKYVALNLKAFEAGRTQR
jgi:indolepyruvate ferredoxin oxidoreductase beta subunit